MAIDTNKTDTFGRKLAAPSEFAKKFLDATTPQIGREFGAPHIESREIMPGMIETHLQLAYFGNIHQLSNTLEQLTDIGLSKIGGPVREGDLLRYNIFDFTPSGYTSIDIYINCLAECAKS